MLFFKFGIVARRFQDVVLRWRCQAPDIFFYFQAKGGWKYMKTLIGGAIAAVLGLIGIVVWFPQFLTVVGGTIPVMLLLGGALAIYLGVDELKDTWNKEEAEQTESETGEEVEKYKKEINELKEEIENLKKE
jgi:hypothetical protein